MRFYTEEHCRAWLAGRGRELPGDSRGLKYTVPFTKKDYSVYASALWIYNNLMMRNQVLIWIRSSDIWTYNSYLYYRLRQSYHDYQLVDEAPGHFFLKHEGEDFVTFLHLALLNGWDGYILVDEGYTDIFFSHDEYLTFYPEREETLAEIREYPPFAKPLGAPG